MHGIVVDLVQVVGERGEKRRETFAPHTHPVGETGEIWTGDDVVKFIESMSVETGPSTTSDARGVQVDDGVAVEISESEGEVFSVDVDDGSVCECPRSEDGVVLG